MLLEQMQHGDSAFVTLTYSEENVPLRLTDDGPVPDTLDPEDTQKFMKKLRKRLYPRELRYFLVGEYGDKTWRPHYHAAIFGLSIFDAASVDAAWGKGFTHTGDLTSASAQYVAGYVTKKLTSPDHPDLQGRYPEFARMSLRPGIGALAIPTLTLATQQAAQFGLSETPSALTMGSKSLQLGRYLTSKLRESLGMTEEEINAEKIAKSEEMRKMLCEANKQEKVRVGSVALPKEWAQKIKQTENRVKIYDARKDKL